MEKENKKKLRPETRKVTEAKGSFQVNIPKKFVTHYGMKAGDSVALVPGSETISILPMRGDNG